MKTLHTWLWSLGISFAILLVLLLAQPVRQSDAQETHSEAAYGPVSLAATTQLTATEQVLQQIPQPLSAPVALPFNLSSNDDGGKLAQKAPIKSSIISFSFDTYTVNEDATTATIRVYRTGSSTSTVTVDYASFDSTAMAGKDYQPISGTLTFEPDQTSATITVPIINDAELEGDERFELRLSNPTGGATIGVQDACRVVIVDDDSLAYGTFQLSASTYSVAESDEQIRITIIRTGGTEGSVAVNYSTFASTAQEGKDYQQVSGVLIFSAGQTIATFSVPILNDQEFEGTERFYVRLSKATGGAMLGTQDSAEVFIVDDDAVSSELYVSGNLVASTPFSLPGQEILLVASLFADGQSLSENTTKDVVVRISKDVVVRIGDEDIVLHDDGTNGDFQADDGMYTASWTSPANGSGSVTATLVYGDQQLDEMTLSFIDDPQLLVLTDWRELYDEFVDTGMQTSEDQNANGVHDFAELVARINAYTSHHRGSVVDVSTVIKQANGFSADYADIAYGGGTTARHQKGLLIDQLIAVLANSTLSSFKNIAIIGDDQVIPFYRVFDPIDYYGNFAGTGEEKSSLERNYPESIGGAQGNAVLEDMEQAYLMSDLPYSIRSYQQIVPETWLESDNLLGSIGLPEPDMGIGRVFAQRPLELIQAIDRYEQPLFLTSGSASASLFVGKEFLQQFPFIIERSLTPPLSAWFGNMFTMYSEQSWLASDLIDALAQNSLIALAGGATHTRFPITPDIFLSAADLETTALDKPVMLVGYGSHLGLSTSDYPDDPSEIHSHYNETLINPLLARGVTVFASGGEGFVYGPDLDAHLYDLLMHSFLTHLLDRNTTTIGDVWQATYPFYHDNDPVVSVNANPASLTFHTQAAYGTLFYGLPTQPLDHVSVVSPVDPDPDGQCSQAETLPTDGTVQRSSFERQEDINWSSFEAVSGTIYMIEAQVPAGSRADVVLDIYTDCEGSRRSGQNYDFTPEVKQSFRANLNGTVYLRFTNEQPDVAGNDVFYDVSVRVLENTEQGQQDGVLILLAEETDEFAPLRPHFQHVVRNIYQVFTEKFGYDDDDIYYLASDTLPAVDEIPSKDHLMDAIANWTIGRVGNDTPVTIYLVGHGRRESFLLNQTTQEVVQSQELDAWMDGLQQVKPDIPINIILDACYSGSFIDLEETLSGPGRVIIASTDEDSLAWSSENGLMFSDHFLKKLEDGSSLYNSFMAARTAVEQAYERQTPWLDGNGNGSPNEQADYDIAQQRYFAYEGPPGSLPLPDISWPPYVKQVQGPASITNGTGSIRAQVLDDLQGVELVRAKIYTPTYELPDTPEEIGTEEVPTIVLQPQGDDWYGIAYHDFSEEGTYHVVVYAEDNENLTSKPKTLQVEVKPAEDVFSPLYLPLVRR